MHLFYFNTHIFTCSCESFEYAWFSTSIHDRKLDISDFFEILDIYEFRCDPESRKKILEQRVSSAVYSVGRNDLIPGIADLQYG